MVLKKLIIYLALCVIALNNGKGKTYCAVEFCEEQSLKNGYEIVTNVKSYAKTLEETKRDYKYIEDMEEMIIYVTECNQSGKKVIIFYDEIFTTLNKVGTLKKEFLSFLSQLRKRQILLITTAQEWSEINITFRRYVRFQVVPNMFALPILHTAFIFKSINDGDLIHWDNEQQDFIAPTIETSFSKGNLDIIQKYDTYETIKTTNKTLTNYHK